MQNLLVGIDDFFAKIVAIIEPIVLVSVGNLPLIVLWVVAGGLFLTVRTGIISIRGFKHAVAIAAGKYDTTEDVAGEVSPFQALTTSLSGTVGLGNIAGVAIAISIGGPGAVVWMSMAAFLGMSIKFVECTLGQFYRQVRSDGTVAGGPMYYLSGGLADLGKPRLGQTLAAAYAVFGIVASLGGGNMFQANQSLAAVVAVVPQLEAYSWLFGIIVAGFVGLVILGGISRIGSVTSRLGPLMVTTYLLGSLWVVAVSWQQIPHAVVTITRAAFLPQAVEGGLIGVMVMAIRRSLFSNGAGLGSAAIAHAASKATIPLHQGFLAILEPFIDTILICNLTALVIVISGQYGSSFDGSVVAGSRLVSASFAGVISWFPVILAVVIFLFAFSTMLTASYYGEKCWEYLIGPETTIVYKMLFLVCIFIGSVVNLGAVVDFSDILLLMMSIPNLLGCMLLSGKVADVLSNYWQQLPLKTATPLQEKSS